MSFDSYTPIDLITDGTTITYGVVQPGPEDTGGVLFIRGGDISAGRINTSNLRTISKELSQKYKRTLLRGGELIISLVGNPGEVAIVPNALKDANIARQVGLIRIDEKRFNPKFVQYYLMSPAGKAQLFSYSLGSVQSVINLKELKRVEIPNTPIGIQGVIVKSLSDIDEKIDLNRRINQTLEAMAQAIFKSWFVDFEPVKAKIAAKQAGRDPLRAAMCAISGKIEADLDALPCEQYTQLATTAALFPDEMEESELGEIPKEWKPATLIELTTKIGSGATPRGGKEVYLENGVALIRSQNVYDSTFVWSGLARISDNAAQQLKNVEVKSSDVLLNITGASILRSCVAIPDVLPARVNQHVAIIRPKENIPSRFIHLHLLQRKTKDYLLGLNTGGSREAVTKAHIESTPIIRPSDPVLAAFQRATNAIYLGNESLARQDRSLAELRDTLLPKLLSGELPVTALIKTVKNA